MKRTKLFLTDTEVVYLQETIPNILTDLYLDYNKSVGSGDTCFKSKNQIKRFIDKIENL